MKYASILALFLIAASLGVPQSGTKPTKSPKQVVADFWKLETEGGRLSDEGWRKAQDFFVRLGPAPQKKTIAIISARAKYSIDERWVKGNQAEIVNECVDMGRIDGELRYTPSDTRYSKTDVVHHLVLTDKHWEFGPDGTTDKEVTGAPAWRIEKPEPIFWLTVDAARRYVTKRRDRTTDALIKQNANRTLAALAKLQ